MSRRIRSIKPELLEDEKTAGLSDTAFRLFIGLITMADDFGTFRADARFVEKCVYWSAIPERGVATAMLELEGLVTFYTVRGQRYGRFRNWAKHQRVDNSSVKRFGTLPTPEESDGSAATRGESPREVEEPPRLAAGWDGMGSDPDGIGAEAREAPAAAPVREEPRSQTRFKSAPPEPINPEAATLAAAIRAEPKLSGCDAWDLARHANPLGKERPLAWLLEAVSDAARDTPQGELVHATQRRLRSYLRYAKAPREERGPPGEVKGGAAYVEADDPATLARIRKQPKRVTAQDAAPRTQTANGVGLVVDEPCGPRAAGKVGAILAGIGAGPITPRQPMTEAELDAKRLDDKRRLAEVEQQLVAGVGAGGKGRT